MSIKAEVIFALVICIRSSGYAFDHRHFDIDSSQSLGHLINDQFEKIENLQRIKPDLIRTSISTGSTWFDDVKQEVHNTVGLHKMGWGRGNLNRTAIQGQAIASQQEKLNLVQINATLQDIGDFPPPPSLKTHFLPAAFRQINNVGPPDPYVRAKDALSLPLVDAFGPETEKIMLDIKEGLQHIFQTKNDLTLAIHGTATTGAHAVLDNLIEPGERVLVFIHGSFGEMLANMSDRLGAEVIRYRTTPGLRFSLEEIESAIVRYRPSLIAIVQGESSTTVKQPLEGIGDICRRYGALFVADVTAIAGIQPVLMDKNKIDAVYCNSNRGIGSVSGLAPVSLSKRAVEKIRNRLTLPRAYQTDLMLQGEIWNVSNPDRYIYHTLSVPLLYAIREGLASVVEEGIENSFRRHEETTDILHSGLTALGLEFYVKNPEDRLTSFAAVYPPPGKDLFKIADYMFRNFNIVISTGLGPTSGKVLRIGTFASNANAVRVNNVLRALESALDSKETNKIFKRATA